MTFGEFVTAYKENTLDRDPAWRGYDILKSARRDHAKQALKFLGYAYAGELALPDVCAKYDIESPERAHDLLRAWWLLRLINMGRRVRGLRKVTG